MGPAVWQGQGAQAGDTAWAKVPVQEQTEPWMTLQVQLCGCAGGAGQREVPQPGPGQLRLNSLSM